jgi:hypothetical protein
MKKEKLLLGYQQLPQNYCMQLSSASEEKLVVLNTKINVPLKGGINHIMYVEGTAQPVYSMLLETKELKDMWGVNFADYFTAQFEKLNYNVLQRPFVFIYNVGLERAVNTTFSSKLLRALIKELYDKGAWVIIESHLPYQKFCMQYELDVPNKIVIPLKKPSSFL